MNTATAALVVVAFLFVVCILYAPIWWFIHRPKASSDAA